MSIFLVMIQLLFQETSHLFIFVAKEKGDGWGRWAIFAPPPFEHLKIQDFNKLKGVEINKKLQGGIKLKIAGLVMFFFYYLSFPL